MHAAIVMMGNMKWKPDACIRSNWSSFSLDYLHLFLSRTF